MPPPKILYKYRPDNDYARRIITHNEVYFAQPHEFNDPFDCKVHTTVDGSRKDKIQFAEQMLRSQYPPDNARAMANSLLQGDPGFFARVRQGFREVHRNAIENDVRVFSMTEVDDDILMWSHYAKHHRGYCIGFDTSRGSVFQGAGEVIYQQDFPIVSLISSDHHEVHRRSLLTKSEHWKYEREWRVIVFEEPEGVQSFESELLCEVIFGCQASEETRNSVLDALGDRPNVRVRKAQMRDREYALDIVDI